MMTPFIHVPLGKSLICGLFLIIFGASKSHLFAAGRLFNVQSTKPVAEYTVNLTPISGNHSIELQNFGQQADPIVYLLDASMTQIASAISSNGQLVLTAPGELSGRFQIIVRSRSATSLQSAKLFIDGVLGSSEVVFTAGDVFRIDRLSDEEKMVGIQQPLGPSEHVAYLTTLDGRTLLRRDAGENTSLSVDSFSTPSVLAIYATNNLATTGPLRVYRNDDDNDDDGDKLGNELEATLGTCASKNASVAGVNCNEIADPRDTDGDGLQDGWEVLGKDYVPSDGSRRQHLPLPKWGANPRHKDIFVEVDYRRLNLFENYNVATHMTPLVARRVAEIYGDADTTDPILRAAHAVSVDNPDRLAGISLHFDIGVPPETPADATIYGDWGGYNPVDAIPDPAGPYWDVSQHVRLVADIDNDKMADIIGFGKLRVMTARSKGGGGFAAAQPAFSGFSAQEAWQNSKHVRLVADINNDSMADIVGFGDEGVQTALSNGDGTFRYGASFPNVFPDFGYNQSWRTDKHVRLLADIDRDGMADIVGFGGEGVLTALSNGDGSFRYGGSFEDFGYDRSWRTDKHVRLLADIDKDGMADIVGFGGEGVLTALSNGDGSFRYGGFLAEFSYDQSWRNEKHIRLLADINNDGMADIVGFGGDGVLTALSNGDGSFRYGGSFADFGYDQSWHTDKHVRLLADINEDGMADIVGFGNGGVMTALSDGIGGFTAGKFHEDFGLYRYIPQEPAVWRQQMSPARHGVFHYVLGYTTPGGSCGQGIACGFDMTDPKNSVHEFGHTLGLDHNGPYGVVEPNCKPNYPSVMNYAYYFTPDYELFSDGRDLSTFNNHALFETGAVSPSKQELLDSLEAYFDYKIDRAAGNVDWNRDGKFTPANKSVRAYGNYAPGKLCEFTREGNTTTGIRSTHSPAILRFNNTIWVFAINLNGQLSFTSATPAWSCSPDNVDNCPKPIFSPIEVRDLDGPVDQIDAKTMIIEGKETVILIGIRPDGSLLETTLSVEAGVPNWGQVVPIASSPATGELSLASTNRKSTLALAYKARDNTVRIRFRSTQGWSNERQPIVGGQPIRMHPRSSPSLIYAGLPVGIELGEHLIGAFADSQGYIQFYTPQFMGKWGRISIPYESNLWSAQGRPVMAWTGGAGDAGVGESSTSTEEPNTYGRLYVLYVQYNYVSPIYHSPTDFVRMAISYVDRAGTLRIGLRSYFDNESFFAYGMSLLAENNGPLRAAVTSAVLPNQGTIPHDEVYFRPHADGISDLPYRNYDDWETLGHGTCISLVDTQSQPRVKCAPF